MSSNYPGRLLLVALAITLCVGCGDGSNGKNGEESTSPESGPLASAGPDRTGAVAPDLYAQPSQMVFLNGGDSRGAEFTWTVIEYTAEDGLSTADENDSELGNVGYRLTSANTPVTGFYADTPGTYTLELTVGDGLGDTDADTADVVLQEFRGGSEPIDPDDRDGDGFLNGIDMFPDDRASHYDFDGDGTGNYYEADVDGDGVADLLDDYPLDASRTRYDEYTEAAELPVTGASNQNDGAGAAEEAGRVPLRITGYILSEDGREDIDVYKVFFTAGACSLVTTADQGAVGMTPSVSVIKADGYLLDQTAVNMAEFNGSSVVSVDIPEDGNYFVRVSDSSKTSDPDWKYHLKIFPDDGDRDGVSDDLETALDSNHLTPDSDGDGVSDFIEIYLFTGASAALLDVDQDNLPAWWDWDSDEDSLADGIEYYNSARQFDAGGVEIFEYLENDLEQKRILALNDADSDGAPNLVDVDSDGNSVSDSQEAEPDFNNPVDTDDDRIPDYLDKDDDGDGLLDVNEYPEKRTVPLELDDIPPSVSGRDGHTGMLLYYLENGDIGANDAAGGGDFVTLRGADLPENAADAWIILRLREGDPINLRPDAAWAESADFTWPDDLPAGPVEVFMAFDDRRSNELKVIGSKETPVLTKVTYDPAVNRATFEGINLNAELELHFTGESGGFDNSDGQADVFTVTPPANAESGMVYVQSETGISNSIYLCISRQVPGSISLPAGVAVDMGDIEISYSLNPEDEIVTPDPSGDFYADIAKNEPTAVTSILKRHNGDDDDYVPFLTAIALPDDANAIVSAESTSLSQVWIALDPGLSLAAESWPTARGILEELEEVEALGHVIADKLAADPFVLADTMNYPMTDGELETAIEAAVDAGALAIVKALLKGYVIPANPSSNPYYKSGGASDIQNRGSGLEPSITGPNISSLDVYPTTDNISNLTVYNDTALYAAVEIIPKDGSDRPVKPETYYSKVIGPQSSFIKYAKTKDLKAPKGKDCFAIIYTAGLGNSYDPETTTEDWAIWRTLYLRTLIDQVVITAIKSIIKIDGLKPGLMTKIMLKHYKAVPNALDKLFRGELDSKGAAKIILKVIMDDLSTGPLGGPITKEVLAPAIFGKSTGQIAQTALKALFKKISPKLVPFVGQIILALDAWKLGSTIVFVIWDTMETDTVVGWDVDYPMQITEARPHIIKPRGIQQTIVVYGAGFSPLKLPKLSFLGVNVSEVNLMPEVKIRNYTKLSEYPFHISEDFYVTPRYINSEGTKMVVDIPGEAIRRRIYEIPHIKVIHPNRTDGQEHGITSQEAFKDNPLVVAALPRLCEGMAFNPSAGYDKRDIYLYLDDSTENALTADFEVKMYSTEIKVKEVSTDGLELVLTLPELEPRKYWPSVRKRYHAKGMSRWSGWYTPYHDNEDYAYTVQDDRVRLWFHSSYAGVEWYVDGAKVATTSGRTNSDWVKKYFDMDRGSVHTFKMVVKSNPYPQDPPAPSFSANWYFTGENIKDYGGSWTSWTGSGMVYEGFSQSAQFMVCEESSSY